jgi:hypothetical protein
MGVSGWFFYSLGKQSAFANPKIGIASGLIGRRSSAPSASKVPVNTKQRSMNRAGTGAGLRFNNIKSCVGHVAIKSVVVHTMCGSGPDIRVVSGEMTNFSSVNDLRIAAGDVTRKVRMAVPDQRRPGALLRCELDRNTNATSSGEPLESAPASAFAGIRMRPIPTTFAETSRRRGPPVGQNWIGKELHSVVFGTMDCQKTVGCCPTIVL